MKKRCFALLLALALGLSTIALGEGDVCVRVGGTVYTTEQVQKSLDMQLKSFEVDQLTDEEKEELKQLVMESFVSSTILHERYIQYGLDQMSEEDAALFARLVDEAYEGLVTQMTQEVVSEYNLTEEAARPVAIELLNGYGYTEEAVREARTKTLEIDRLMAYLDIQPDEMDSDAFYQENLVDSSRELFESDPDTYDLALQSDEQQVYYMPADCRRVEQLLMNYPSEIQTQLDALQSEMDAAQAAADVALSQMNAASDENSAEAQKTYNDQCAAYEAAKDKRAKLFSDGLAAVKPTLDEVLARYHAGEAFSALIAEYEGDSVMPKGGYVVRQSSAIWPDGFTEAAFALEATGEVCEPFATQSGVHLLRYAADEPEGAVVPDDATQTLLSQYAAADSRDAKLKERLAQWLTDYSIAMDGSGLMIP
ncbi:MAG: peptidylprolyl isomerase [Eubacteriales bacterium]|nr:peptidylprolyl isomerase [Eubacteriales bacterium]